MNFKQILKEFRKGMELFAKSIAVFVNSVLLSVVYFLGVGITTVLAKLFKKKFLKTKLDKESDTYWQDFDLKKKKIGEYYRQF